MSDSASRPAEWSPTRIGLDSTSRAADSGFIALSDIAEITAALGVEYRIVGGHMVTLLVAAHGVSDDVPLRETLDADFGALPHVVADPRLAQALRAHGYTTPGVSNRFVRQHRDVDGELDLVIDVLAPSYEGRLVSNQQHGELFVDEIPGLAYALNRPPAVVELSVRLLDGRELDMQIALPELASALCIKAFAYRERFADKDAVDLWRLMNAAHSAGLGPDTWPATVAGRRAAEVLRRIFGKPASTGLNQISSRRSDQTRMRALVRAVIGPDGGAG